MKLFEICSDDVSKKTISEQFKAQMPSFGKMQQIVFDAVLAELKLTPEQKQEAATMKKQTDQFFSSYYDELYDRFEEININDEDFDLNEIVDLKDHLTNTAEDVTDILQNYYTKAINHAPGFKPFNAASFNIRNKFTSRKWLEDVISKIRPELLKV